MTFGGLGLKTASIALKTNLEAVFARPAQGKTLTKRVNYCIESKKT